MKIVVLTFYALLLVACGRKEASKSAAIIGSTPVPSEVLLQTDRYEVQAVLTAASELIRHKSPLSPLLAERCWNRERGRPAVAQACILAWAIGKENSPLLEKAILENIRNSELRARPIALAAGRREELLKNFEYSDLEILLTLTKGDPLWLRARLALAWLKAHSDASQAQKENLLASFRGDFESLNLLGPKDLENGFELAKALDPNLSEKIAASFCDRGIQGLAQSRCFRFLSALAPGSSEEMKNTKFPYHITAQDLGWKLFSSSFPDRAKKLNLF